MQIGIGRYDKTVENIQAQTLFGGNMNNRGTGKYEQLLERCRKLEAIPTAVAHPCEASALAGAMEAANEGLIQPILVGPVERIKDVAKQAKVELGDVEILVTNHSHESATQAEQLVLKSRIELLMSYFLQLYYRHFFILSG